MVAIATGIVSLFIVGWVMIHAQRFANLACGDPDGKDDSRFGAANFAWILLGLLLWLLAIAWLVMTPDPRGSNPFAL